MSKSSRMVSVILEWPSYLIENVSSVDIGSIDSTVYSKLNIETSPLQSVISCRYWSVVVRLVRLQRRIGRRVQHTRIHVHRRDDDRRGERRPRLGWVRLRVHAKTLRPELLLRRGGRSRRHHPGLGICGAVGRRRDRAVYRAFLQSLDQGQKIRRCGRLVRRVFRARLRRLCRKCFDGDIRAEMGGQTGRNGDWRGLGGGELDSGGVPTGLIHGHRKDFSIIFCSQFNQILFLFRIFQAAWSFVMSILLLCLINLVPGLHLRQTEEDETRGGDFVEMGEVSLEQNFILRLINKCRLIS